jgi:predicted AAA+ superfamily ATPase
MDVDPGDALVRALHDHNPWWKDGTAAFSLPARQKSDFYHLARPDRDGSQFQDSRVLGIVGRRGVGKTTLLHQFVHHRIQAGDAPERYCYLPFDADPLYQLQSDDQLRQAVRYYETRILGRTDADGPHFLLLDDVHQIEHPAKPTVDGWGTPVRDLLDDAPDRHVAVTASAGVQIERELDRVDLPASDYDVQPILPEKFRDYCFSLHPDLEADDTRVSPSPLRTGEESLPTAVETGEIDPLLDGLQAQYEKIADVERRIQSTVVDYLAMGGTIGFAQGGAVESTRDLDPEDYQRLREHVRTALYQEIPGFESIQTIADLERLCALAARTRGADPIRFQTLVDLFDVDRRTIADSYLPALAELYLCTGVTEYDNSRPRALRLYLRDTGLVTALADGDATTVRNDFEREADLARVAAFDHTMRFAYGIEAAQGREREPGVAYWRGQSGTVDYVFEIDDTPVPVALAYRARQTDTARESLREFQQAYDAPVGFVLAGDVPRDEPPIAEIDPGVVRLPYWFYLLLC